MLAKNLEAANLSNPIEVIDIDENNEMAIEYNIRSVPTLLFKDEPNNRLVGSRTAEQIREWANG
jgi:thioredoxin-like negative regulator of GroEL